MGSPQEELTAREGRGEFEYFISHFTWRVPGEPQIPNDMLARVEAERLINFYYKVPDGYGFDEILGRRTRVAVDKFNGTSPVQIQTLAVPTSGQAAAYREDYYAKQAAAQKAFEAEQAVALKKAAAKRAAELKKQKTDDAREATARKESDARLAAAQEEYDANLAAADKERDAKFAAVQKRESDVRQAAEQKKDKAIEAGWAWAIGLIIVGLLIWGGNSNNYTNNPDPVCYDTIPGGSC
ncbi:MAG: hypothetical protein ACOH2F_03645 [Cellulomonas sp.]